MGGAVQPIATSQQQVEVDESPRASPIATTQRQQPRLSTPQQEYQQLLLLQQQQQQQSRASAGAYKDLDPRTVAEALEKARDSPDGVQDPEVSGTLESALDQIWDRVLAQPDSYVMTRGEFAVFNLYQHLFLGNDLAMAARRRYWDNTHG
ncbi:hypothetical protein VP1G_10026 [Cytospora mali]|uniref:Uncharacterized protein n=1 Tax=Cytospora mali TaxID=578113 RepID=A0A194VGA3_CYTMA|nr:hypothetical protein VP1G_10026 [Valsa mali var. pyri (nom. inval.)]